MFFKALTLFIATSGTIFPCEKDFTSSKNMPKTDEQMEVIPLTENSEQGEKKKQNTVIKFFRDIYDFFHSKKRLDRLDEADILSVDTLHT